MHVKPSDDDPIIAEIRRFREEYLASFGYDMDLLMEDVRQYAQKIPGRRVSYKGERRRRPTGGPGETAVDGSSRLPGASR